MGIRYKTFLIGIITFILITGATIPIFYFSYFGYINKDEEQRIKRDYDVLNYIIEKEESNLNNSLYDWGNWDDTYEFINDQNNKYIESNLGEESLVGLDLKAIIFLDKNKDIVYAKEADNENKISKELISKLKLNDKDTYSDIEQKDGLLADNGKIYMIGITAITSSDKQKESNGSLIMVREINGKFFSYLENIIPVDLTIEEAKEQFKQKDNRSYMTMDNNLMIYSKENHQARKLSKDINGEETIQISITDKSYSNGNINYFLRNFIFNFLFIIIIITIIIMIIVHKFLLKRLIKLTKFIEKVATTKDDSLTINMSGKDEIYKLADEVNIMLSALHSAKEELSYLNYSDKLTGLKNRSYMEKIFDRLDENKETDYYIIIGDINGLKLINAELGHLEGNKLICFVAKILKENCAPDDIISRWGGDGFVILAQNKDEEYAANLIDKIKDKFENEDGFASKISIAWGYAGFCGEKSNTEAVMILAEDRMYRNKLMEVRSARSATVSSLLRTLHEKHSETEEHTRRIKYLSVKLGKRIGLPKEKLDELELFSLLHDIGKIGIPEHILMKPGKLTNEEWTTMKTHSEIGCRIASSTPELVHIANEILAHHERYDGTGYPNNLKGEEIPLLSRILCIVDSFDVMTHKRIYKEAFDKEYVIEELKRCSGTQFDPYLVKEFIKLLEEEGYLNN